MGCVFQTVFVIKNPLIRSLRVVENEGWTSSRLFKKPNIFNTKKFP